MSSPLTADLLPHPDTPCPAVRQLRVRVSGHPDTALILIYEVIGDLGAVRIPAPMLPEAADELWQHTCFEVFVARAGEAAYREYNFSPSGQWAAYTFGDYRVRAEARALPAPRLHLTRQVDRLELQAMLPPGALPGGSGVGHGDLQLGLSAVIEGVDGSRSYWALRHPAARPDFHHRDSFALSLGTPA